jgi:hypothetical protein
MDNIVLFINVSSKKREKRLALGSFSCNHFKKVSSNGSFRFDCLNNSVKATAIIAATTAVIQWLCHSINQGLMSIMIKNEMKVTTKVSRKRSE